MSRDDVDVLVVGAGPVGLAIALQLHDHGAQVRVVERRSGSHRPSRALIVHPRTLEVLRPLGVTPALLAGGDASPSVHLHLGAREVPVRLGRFDLPDVAFPHLLFIRQAVVEQVLHDALAGRGVEVERSVELVGLDGHVDRPVARLRSGGQEEELACRFVAGCDGADSTVRAQVGVAWEGAPYRREIVLADLELAADLAAGVAHVVAGRSGVLFLFAIGERATWRMLVTRDAVGGDGAFGQPGSPVPVGDLQAMIDDAGLAACITEVGWSARVPLQHRMATHYRDGDVFVVGDAAHVHSPAGGLGMNTGLQDALNLGWKLAFAARMAPSDPRLDALLDSYELERRPVAKRVMAMTNALFWAEAGTHPVASFGRGVLAPLAAPVVPLLLRQRRLLAQAIRTLSQLRVQYRTSGLSVEESPRASGGPRAGERLPDAPLSSTGGPVRLHELLAHPGFHVLLHRDATPIVEALGPLVDVHRVPDWPGDGVVVVRPDGYVGFRSGSADVARIERWLGSVGAGLDRDDRPGRAR